MSSFDAPTLNPSYVQLPNFKTQVCSSNGKYFNEYVEFTAESGMITVRRELRNWFAAWLVCSCFFCTMGFVCILFDIEFSTYFHINLAGAFINRRRLPLNQAPGIYRSFCCERYFEISISTADIRMFFFIFCVLQILMLKHIKLSVYILSCGNLFSLPFWTRKNILSTFFTSFDDKAAFTSTRIIPANTWATFTQPK